MYLHGHFSAGVGLVLVEVEGGEQGELERVDVGPLLPVAVDGHDAGPELCHHPDVGAHPAAIPPLLPFAVALVRLRDPDRRGDQQEKEESERGHGNAAMHGVGGRKQRVGGTKGREQRAETRGRRRRRRRELMWDAMVGVDDQGRRS